VQRKAIFFRSSPSPKDRSDEVAKKKREEQRRKGTKVLGAAARRKQQPAQHNTTQETLAERRSQAAVAMGAGKPTENLLRNQQGGRPMRKGLHGSTAVDRRGIALQHFPIPSDSRRGKGGKERLRERPTGRRDEESRRDWRRAKREGSEPYKGKGRRGRDSTNRQTDRQREKEREREKRRDGDIDWVDRCAAQRSGATLYKLG
jgi:hypothetical protein